jgi:TP53 regulating kinase-like protein
VCRDRRDELEKMQLFHQGAEATLYIADFLGFPAMWKQRVVKKYRHEELDQRIRTRRLFQEARTLLRCRKLQIRVPAIYFIDPEESILVMQYISDSIVLKNYLNQPSNRDISSIAMRVGETIAKLHNGAIIHGDLTTSNFLVVHKDNDQTLLYLIDFGLSFYSNTEEDKAVDLYVLERAILTTMKENEVGYFWEKCIETYSKHAKDASKVLQRLEQVRRRGRKLSMIG